MISSFGMRWLLLFLLLSLGTVVVDATTTKEGKEFLAAKEKEEGVVKLESGVLYKELVSGNGTKRPVADRHILGHYSARLIDGTEYDASRRHTTEEGGMTYRPNQVSIKGWTEALLLMKEGDKWEVYVPSELAYGEQGRYEGLVPPGAVIVLELELIKAHYHPHVHHRRDEDDDWDTDEEENEDFNYYDDDDDDVDDVYDHHAEL